MGEMRADRGAFPPVEGLASHVPIWTRQIRGEAATARVTRSEGP